MAYAIDALFDSREKLKAIAQMMDETGLTRIKFKNDDEDSVIELERGCAPMINNNINNSSPAAEPAAQPAAPTAAPAAAAEKVDGTPVKAPMVGVFYAAPAPEEKPYVQVGDKVKKGDTLCIIEAMKLMNEISADQDGEIAQICVEDGELVEYGQTLFMLK